MKRKALSQKTRFEVFKRDSFTCQYCGAKAPDVVLQVDHIQAVAVGGKNDVLNLITSCKACNGGKGATALSDASALDRQRQQLADLEERRQQIELMVKWKTELSSQDDTLVSALEAELVRRTTYGFSPSGRVKAKVEIKRCGFSTLFDAIDAAVSRHYRVGTDGKITSESASAIFAAMWRIANNVKLNGNHPDGADFAYIQGILRNRTDDPHLRIFPLLKMFREEGVGIEFMRDAAKVADTESQFEKACWKEMDRLKVERERGKQ